MMSPCPTASPVESTSFVVVSSAANVRPFCLSPNSDDCLIRLTVSPPAVANAITSAPELSACKMNEA